MNKYLLRNFLYAICMGTLLFACDDNDDQDGSGISGIYSNKLSTPEGDNTLTLTYSGREFIGKDVTFKQVNGNTANITASSPVKPLLYWKIFLSPPMGTDIPFQEVVQGTTELHFPTREKWKPEK